MADSIPRTAGPRRTNRQSALRSVPTANRSQLSQAVLPAGDLGRYLRAITLPGAPALNFPLWGLRRGADLYPLPVTNPSALRQGWLAGELAKIPLNGTPLRRKDVERLVAMIAPGPSRMDGLPYYRADFWGWGEDRTSKGGGRGTARRLAMAVAADLADHSLREVSAKLLRKREGKRARPALYGDSERARELRRHARRYLAQLGTWPWTHAPAGKLPASWRTHAGFLEPLQAWYERARREIDQALASSARALSEGHSLRRSDLLTLLGDTPVELPPHD